MLDAFFRSFKYLSLRANGREGTCYFQPINENTEVNGSGYDFVSSEGQNLKCLCLRLGDNRVFPFLLESNLASLGLQVFHCALPFDGAGFF